MAFSKPPLRMALPDLSGPPLRMAPPDPNDPKEIRKAHEFAREILNWNIDNSRFTGRYIQRTYNTVFAMYFSLFVVGIGTAITAIVKGFLNNTDVFSTLIFAGLSSASFFTLFISRPLESLERNTFFSSWVVAIMNNYWTRLAYLNDPDPVKMSAELQAAADELTTELSNLADKYAAAVGTYTPLVTASPTSTNVSMSQTENQVPATQNSTPPIPPNTTQNANSVQSGAQQALPNPPQVVPQAQHSS